MKAGYVEIPANTPNFQVNFNSQFGGTYSVALTNLFSNSQKIIYSIASVNQNGFKIYPYDTSTGTTPSVALGVFWVAVRRKS